MLTADTMMRVLRTYATAGVPLMWWRTTHFFIHIPKNGGRNVRKALKRRVAMSEPYWHHHYRDLGERLRGLRPFAIVRNPWSRTYSRYKYMRQQSLKWPDEDPRKAYLQGCSFEQFVMEAKYLVNPALPGKPWTSVLHWGNQLEWVTDEGELVCDCLRLEHLREDVTRYLGRRVRLARAEKPDRYRRVFSKEMRERVGELYADDIELFGFSFDGPATKNIATG